VESLVIIKFLVKYNTIKLCFTFEINELVDFITFLEVLVYTNKRRYVFEEHQFEYIPTVSRMACAA
jgi:hypothetical protein